MIGWKSTPISNRGDCRGLDCMDFLLDVAAVEIPHVQPYPAARSIVICDNVSLHHAFGGMLKAMVEAKGGKLIFLPT